MINMVEDINEIIPLLSEILEDNTVPRNVKSKIEEIIKCLNDESELSLRINKALDMLAEISDDNNIQPYTRTQIWNLVSMLEALN